MLTADLRTPPEKLVIWFSTDDRDARQLAETLFHEGRTYRINSRYSARFDRGITPHTKDHIHGLAKGKELFALNFDGTSHHTKAGTQIPTDIATWIASEFPQCKIPPNRIIQENENPNVRIHGDMISSLYEQARNDPGIQFIGADD